MRLVQFAWAAAIFQLLSSAAFALVTRTTPMGVAFIWVAGLAAGLTYRLAPRGRTSRASLWHDCSLATLMSMIDEPARDPADLMARMTLSNQFDGSHRSTTEHVARAIKAYGEASVGTRPLLYVHLQFLLASAGIDLRSLHSDSPVRFTGRAAIRSRLARLLPWKS